MGWRSRCASLRRAGALGSRSPSRGPVLRLSSCRRGPATWRARWHCQATGLPRPADRGPHRGQVRPVGYRAVGPWPRRLRAGTGHRDPRRARRPSEAPPVYAARAVPRRSAGGRLCATPAPPGVPPGPVRVPGVGPHQRRHLGCPARADSRQLAGRRTVRRRGCHPWAAIRETSMPSPTCSSWPRPPRPPSPCRTPPSALSGLARKFVGGGDHAARACVSALTWVSMRRSRSLRSARVNFQSNGRAMAL